MTADNRELEVLIGAGGGAAEALMLVGQPRADGRVTVRSWTSGDWSREPEARERVATELFAEIERAARVGRSVRPELGTVREWLAR